MTDVGQDQRAESATIRRVRGIGTAAVILMLGNLTGSLFGFGRGVVIADVFGAHARTDAFVAASIVPQMFYDLVIGAAVGAALIPSFTEIRETRGMDALRRTAGAVLALAWLVLAIVIALLFVAARPLMQLILWGYRKDPAELNLAVDIVHILIPTLFFLGTSAVCLALLYSLRHFTVPAFAPSLYHVGIIIGAILLGGRLGIMALPVGALAGSICQALAQTAGVLRHGVRLTVRLEFTPEIRRIIRLYLPVAAGLLVSIVGQILDIGFKSEQGRGPITDMLYATMLTQFPIGIAVAAMSFAVLPSIASEVALGQMERYKETLAMGVRLVLFLTIPAAVAYLALASPISSLIYQRGHLTPHDASLVSLALIGYAIQIPFVGLDQMLIFSFYARNDTLTPMLVGVVGVIVYVIGALILGPRYHVLGLALANTLQNSLHAVILLVLLLSAIGTFGGTALLKSIGTSLAAAAVMGVAAAVSAQLVGRAVDTHVFAGQALATLGPLALAGVLYLLVAAMLRSQELALALQLARSRLS